MDDQVQEQMIDGGEELLGWLRGAVESSGEFAAEQAPLLAQEIVRWGIWLPAGIVLVCLLLQMACLVLARKAYSRYLETKDVNGCPFCFMMMLGALGVILLIPILTNTFRAFKPIIAPHLYIIERIAELL